MAATTIGTGTTVVFGTSGFTAHIMEVSWSGIERESVESTHMGTTDAKTFIPGKLYDAGEIEMEIAFDGDDTPPIDAAPETITVTWAKKNAGSANGARWSATGFVTEYEASAPLEDKMTGNITIKITGAIQFTDES